VEGTNRVSDSTSISASSTHISGITVVRTAVLTDGGPVLV